MKCQGWLSVGIAGEDLGGPYVQRTESPSHELIGDSGKFFGITRYRRVPRLALDFIRLQGSFHVGLLAH